MVADPETNETPTLYVVNQRTGKIIAIEKDDGRFIGSGFGLPIVDWMPKEVDCFH